jgi:hypothetical protein
VASQKSKRSRKRRNPESAPRAVASTRREERAERQVVAARQQQRGQRVLGTVGERPSNPLGLPVSEVAILAGIIALIVGFFNHGGPALIVGVICCAGGVIEFTAREHFSGYRSHASLLALIPALGAGIGLVSLTGVQGSNRAPVLLAFAVPIGAVLFWFLRRRFLAARQARVARPPAP